MTAAEAHRQAARLHGIDIARFIAFIGMVAVNFTLVLVGTATEGGTLATLLQGKAAASFVLLAGLGLGLARLDGMTLIARAAFLFVLGLLNAIVFPPDILHYYAVYFLLALPFLGWSSRALVLTGIAVGVIATLGLMVFDYSAGWNWQTLDYSGFWTLGGFFRNLFYNGFHPVLPWFAFLLFGLAIARMDLAARDTPFRLIGGGVGLLLGSSLVQSAITNGIPELAELAQPAPMPPGPVYLLAGTGAGLLLIGLCLLLAPWLGWLGRAMAAAGRQSLTLYMAHIFLGMGAMEALGLLEAGTAMQALQWTAGFSLLALIYAVLWEYVARRGPLEAAMRWMTTIKRPTQ